MSKLNFKYGAMNSGKSDTLIKTAYNYEERGLKVLTAKPSVDTKGDEMIVARGGAARKVDFLVTPEMDVRENVKKFMAQIALEEVHCVLVDEAQFLTEPQVDQLLQVAKLDEISVIAFGLRTDFKTQLFSGSRRLLELADNIEKLPTMCRCNSQAEFNCRKKGDTYVFEGDQIAIDGEDETSYDSLCGECYLTEQAKGLASSSVTA
jgi:thymidine kinase